MPGGDEIAFAGMARQAEMVRKGEVTPTERVGQTLERIDRLDPELNAFRKVFSDKGMLEAEQAEARRAAGDKRPLLGVPIAIKDEVDVAGEINLHGTDAFEVPAKADAEFVRRLREAGAIIVGLTLLPELAICGFTESATYGVTRNPWNLQRPPGGSNVGPAPARPPARSASPPPAAASSASSRPAAASPSRRSSKAGGGWWSKAASAARCSTRRSGSTSSPAARPRPKRRRRPPSLSSSRSRTRPASSRSPGRRRRRGRSPRPRSPTRSRARPRTPP